MQGARWFSASMTIALGLIGCRRVNERAPCQRDLDCPAGEVCWFDNLCLPAALADRLGGSIGDPTAGGSNSSTTAGGGGSRDGGAPPLPEECERAPLFGGAAEAIADGPDAVIVQWFPAADFDTAPEQIEYLVSLSTVAGEHDFINPDAIVVGETSHRFDGLTAGTTYHFAVEARNAGGFLSCSGAEVSATPEALPDCVDYETYVRPIFESSCVRCHTSDDPDAPRGLHLDSLEGVLAGGATQQQGGLAEITRCRPDESLLFLKIALDDPPVGRRMPYDGPPYLASSQIDAVRRWIEGGARRSCAELDVCSDPNPPTFAGLERATPLDATRAELCWSAGTDDVTEADSIVYDVFVSNASGGQTFDRPSASSTPGATCTVLDALSPELPYCFVVRARDGAGNRDANVRESCIMMPAVPPGCVEFDTQIAPLFQRNCTRCHSGSLPPQHLRLDSYAGVMAGNARRNAIRACDVQGSLLLGKVSETPPIGERMPRDGPPYLTDPQIALLSQWVATGARPSCAAPDPCTDTTAPVFGGAIEATDLDGATIRVRWSAASDDRTPASLVRYDLYEATTSGAQSLAAVPQRTVTGVESIDIPVGPGASLCFVVRARDLHDRRDTNSVEVCASTPASSSICTEHSAVEPILAARCTHCHGEDRPPRHLRLDSYGAILAGGTLGRELRACNWSQSLINTKTAGSFCGERMPRDGPPYLAPSERALLSAWVSSGARRSCSDPSPCADTTPPAFAGFTSATAVDGTTIELCWTEASDDVSAATDISYEIFEGSSPGGENLAAPPSYVASGSETCRIVRAAPARNACFVVRARDLFGNTSAFSSEVCVSPPGECVEYEELIQPLFDARCIHCHSGPNPPKDVDWTDYDYALYSGEVEPCRPENSTILDMVNGCEMPFDTAPSACGPACLTPSERALINSWVEQGAARSCPGGGCQ